MLDLKGRANVAMARWGPGVHQQSIWNYRQQEGRPVSEIPDDDVQTEPPGDPVLTGDVLIDEALVRLDTLERREVSEHPAEFEQIHRVLRDSLTGTPQRDEGPRPGA